ncbi:hypothetical protein R3I93_008581 [Phoxinus phoxinus]|uniref:Uncharacterized protein n=1 Tax=Phoxinus phoxinus TaxID=58324 RepID=A0AAN9D0H3_9TELE
MDRSAVVKVGAVASATVCALFGGVVLAQYMFTKKQRAGKKTKIIEMKHTPQYMNMDNPVVPSVQRIVEFLTCRISPGMIADSRTLTY